MAQLLTVEAPAAAVAQPEELSAYLKLADTPAEDVQLTALIAAATDHAEQYTSRAFVSRTLSESRNVCEMVRAFSLFRGPVTAVESVKVDGVTLEDDEYDWSGDTVALTTPLWVGQSIEVEYTAGYGATAASVPAALRQAVLRLAASMYEQPTDVIVGAQASTLPVTVKSILNGYRRSLL